MINRNAIEIAAFLKDHPAIEQVWHPSLADQELYDRYARSKRVMEGSFPLHLNFRKRIILYDKLAVAKVPNSNCLYALLSVCDAA